MDDQSPIEESNLTPTSSDPSYVTHIPRTVPPERPLRFRKVSFFPSLRKAVLVREQRRASSKSSRPTISSSEMTRQPFQSAPSAPSAPSAHPASNQSQATLSPPRFSSAGTSSARSSLQAQSYELIDSAHSHTTFPRPASMPSPPSLFPSQPKFIIAGVPHGRFAFVPSARKLAILTAGKIPLFIRRMHCPLGAGDLTPVARLGALCTSLFGEIGTSIPLLGQLADTVDLPNLDVEHTLALRCEMEETNGPEEWRSGTPFEHLYHRDGKGSGPMFPPGNVGGGVALRSGPPPRRRWLVLRLARGAKRGK